MARANQFSDEVEAHVRAEVLAGRIKPGQYVRIDAAARSLGLSATPVREALQRLRREGLVHLDPYKGFRVAPLSRQDMADLFSVQRTLAVQLATRAAPLISDEVIEQVAKVQDEIRLAVGRGDLNRAAELHSEFHRLINRSAKAPKLGWMLASTVRYSPPDLLVALPQWTDVSDADHVAIVTALRARDAAALGVGMARHIENVERTLIRHMEESGFWGTAEAAEAA